MIPVKYLAGDCSIANNGMRMLAMTPAKNCPKGAEKRSDP
jgi:hypothetical protein